jgi:hypothetical protein
VWKRTVLKYAVKGGGLLQLFKMAAASSKLWRRRGGRKREIRWRITSGDKHNGG